MSTHSLTLADPRRLEAFALVGRAGLAFRAAAPRLAEDGLPWLTVGAGGVAVGVTALGPNSAFDPQAPPELQEAAEARRQALRAAPGAEQREALEEAVTELRLGKIAERLLWALHLAARRAGRSLFRLPDLYLAQAAWGVPQGEWPRDWRQVLCQVLRSLARLHVGDKDDQDFCLGEGTALLYHAGDLKGEGDDHCPQDCVCLDGPRHHHFQIDLGPGFLGELERLAEPGDEAGVREYDFSPGRRPGGGPSLRAVGRSGRVANVYVPAKLGAPSRVGLLTDAQRALLQSLVRETTRVGPFAGQAPEEEGAVAGRGDGRRARG